MKFVLIWPGKTKEDFIKSGIEKYIKYIRSMAKVEVVEIKEAKGAGGKALDEEGRRILEQAEKGTHGTGQGYVLLDERGKQMSSPEFARFIETSGGGRFVIGGAFGVSGEVREKAASMLSLSKMTLPHELARVFLLEQIYRGLSIIGGKGYHHA
ncbi:MAG: 23S rRNA (pseudouridine(1915)-N(3))-methyltransferase RlmH [Actinomycetota bacterium]|nr:23S rRNA (pseudouridine(1915)-N(3))-methyltransferase RlmH [Actinomycetota bacterium]